MAATTTPTATRAAVKILESGGNAIDAAAAAHFALMVTDPANASLAGRTQILVRLKDGSLLEIDGATEAPVGVAASRTMAESERQGYLVAPIPGNTAALDMLIRRHGRLKLADALQPAIELAENGFEIAPGAGRTWAASGMQLIHDPGAARNFLQGGTQPYNTGALFRQPQLAATLRQIAGSADSASSGADAFYRGPIAERIVEDMKKNGGYITSSDLANYRAREGPVVRTTYRGYEVASAGGNAWGDTLIEMLNIAREFRFGTEPDGAELDLLARIMSTALEDRPQELSTLRPKPRGLALSQLSNPRFAAERANAIRAGLHSKPSRSAERVRVEPPGAAPHDTTHLAIMDREGNTVSQTTSIGPSFGARVATPELGFLYGHSYRMRADPTPGARDETEMTPTILSRNGKPFLAIGAAGSERIPTAILQVIIDIIDRGLPAGKAVAAPRIFAIGDLMLMNASFPPAAAADLRRRGYDVKTAGQDFRQHLGIVQAVQYDAGSGMFSGAADPAYDGAAAGPVR
jgi:gamma-glutamyltranspeptidase/glutathione hydrolase